jgi:hypothetical protein
VAEPESDYLRERAEAEIPLAQAAAHPAAVRAPYLTAGFSDGEAVIKPDNQVWLGRGRY